MSEEQNESQYLKAIAGILAAVKQMPLSLEEKRERQRIATRKYRASKLGKEKIIKYREDNREKVREENRKYYADNKEKISATHKKYREDNKEKEQVRHRIYYEKNKEKVLAQRKKYYENNIEVITQRQKKYIEKNKETRKEYNSIWIKTDKGIKTRYVSCWKYNGLIDDYDKVYERYEYTLFCDECRCDLDQCTKSVKCMDHDHETGLFRNVLCWNCNIRRR